MQNFKPTDLAEHLQSLKITLSFQEIDDIYSLMSLMADAIVENLLAVTDLSEE